MKRLRCHFPHDPDYDFGDANHLPIVPSIVENPDDTSRPALPNPPAPGDAGTKEHTP